MPSMHSIAIYTGTGAHPASVTRTMDALAQGPWPPPIPLGAEDFRPAHLGRHGLVILPGGRGNAICRDLGAAGRDALRAYAAEGGSVLGICAGMYAMALPFPWALHMLPVAVQDPTHWQRGRARTGIRLTDEGRATFATHHTALTVAFRDGPVVGPDGSGDPYDVLATYEEDLAHPEGTPGIMAASPAAVQAPFGSGLVMGIGPHLEDIDDHRPLLVGAVSSLTRLPAPLRPAPES